MLITKICVALLAVTGLAARQPISGKYVEAARLPIGKSQLLLAVANEPGTAVAIVARHSTSGPSTVRVVDIDGRERWRKDIDASVVLASARGSSILLIERATRYGEQWHAQVLDWTSGTEIGSTDVANDSQIRQTARGDAIFWYPDPISGEGKTVSVMSLRMSSTRTINLGEAPGVVAAVDASKLFVLTQRGKLQSFVNGNRAWSKQVDSDYGTLMDVSIDGSTVLVGLILNRFAVFDGTSGRELVRYDPASPGMLFRRLHFPPGPDGQPNTTPVNLKAVGKPSLAPDGNVVLGSGEGQTELEFDPRSGLVVNGDRLKALTASLETPETPRDRPSLPVPARDRTVSGAVFSRDASVAVVHQGSDVVILRKK